MPLLGLINYEDYLLKTLLRSSFTKDAGSVVLMYTVTSLVRFHLSLFLCYITNIGPISYWVTPIIINVLLNLASTTIYEYVSIHRKFYQWIVEYLICNYSEQRMIIWKRWVMGALCLYIFTALFMVEVNNYMLFVSTIQYIISFGICDIIEQLRGPYIGGPYAYGTPLQRKVSTTWTKVTDYIQQPKVTVHGDIVPIDDYLPPATTTATVVEQKEVAPEWSTTFDKKEDLSFDDAWVIT